MKDTLVKSSIQMLSGGASIEAINTLTTTPDTETTKLILQTIIALFTMLQVYFTNKKARKNINKEKQ